MFLLTDIYDEEKDRIEYKEHKLHLDMSFDNILRLWQLFGDEHLSDVEKILIALEMLVYEYELIEEEAFEEQLALYKAILKEFLDIDVDPDEEEKDQEIDLNEDSGPVKKAMDFQKDAGLIYASFLSEYQMDLFEMQDKLHWDRFSVLLSNLGDKTAFKQVVSYRTMKVPTVKESSKEYREHVIKMKRLYNLEDEESKVQSMENKLDTFTSSFK